MNGEQCKETGCFFYGAPNDLTEDMIDPLIWTTVKRINESGWVWTAESCQGHPDSVDKHAWAGNVCPMLRLVTRKESLGRLMAELMEASLFVEDLLHRSIGYRVYRTVFAKDTGWREVLVYVEARNAYDRNHGIAAFQRFAEACCKTSFAESPGALIEQNRASRMI